MNHHIVVKTLDKKTWSFGILPGTTVYQLKHLIEEESGLPADHIILFHNKTRLTDSMTVDEFNDIMLVLKLRGD